MSQEKSSMCHERRKEFNVGAALKSSMDTIEPRKENGVIPKVDLGRRSTNLT
jgi:hypothetical protein